MHEIIDLLKQIASNTKNGSSIVIWVAGISAASVLLGSFLTSFISYLSQKKQLHGNIITTERIRWLKDLREAASIFYTNLDMQYNYLKRPIPPAQISSYQQILDDISREVMKQCHDIVLLLNSKNKQQKIAIEKANEALHFILNCFQTKSSGSLIFNDNLYKSIKDDFFNSIMLISDETWKIIENFK